MITIKPDDNWHKIITEEVQKEYFIRNKGKLCVDIGANTGAFTLKAHDMFDRIISIEAYSENYKYMLTKIAHLNNVIPIHAAVWSKSNEKIKIKAFSMSLCPGHHSVIDWWREKRGWNDSYALEEVTTISLDDLIKNYGHIDLLKIDVEGSEYDILYGKDLSEIDAIAGEIHLMLEDKVNALIEYLEKYFIINKYHGDGVSTNIVFDGIKR